MSEEQWWANDPIATGKGGKPITMAGAGKAPTEDQGKVGSFYLRAIGANGDYEKTGTDANGNSIGMEPRGVLQSAAHAILPTSLENPMLSPDRQRADAAQREFIAATLRRDSGAAISQGEFDNQYKLYFPVSGDDPSTITQKAEARRRAIAGLKIGTTPDLATGAETFSKEQGSPIPSATVGKPPLDPEHLGDIGFASKDSAEANSLPAGSQGFQKAYQAWINDGTPKTADQIIAWAKEHGGFNANPADAKAVADYLAKGGRAGVNVATPTFAKPDISADRGAGGAAETGKAFVRGIPNVLGIDDELNAVGDTLSGGTLRENLARERAIRDYDEKNHWIARDLGTLAGGLAIPTGAPGAARAAGTEALRAGEGMAAARAAARSNFAQRMGLEGAGISGLYGIGSSDGDLGDRLTSGLGSAIAGGAMGYGAARLGQAFGIGTRRPPGGGGSSPVEPIEGRQVAAAADRQAISVLPADVGGVGTRMATGATAMTLGGIPLAEAAERSIGSAAAARNRIADMAGSASSIDGVVDATGAGQAIQRGAREFIDDSATRGGRMFEAIPVAPDRAAILTSTRKALGDLTQGMESNPELSRMVAENPRLKGFLDALTVKKEPIMGGSPGATPVKQIGTAIDGGNLSWQDMKRFRSIVGEIIGQPGIAEDTSSASLRKLYASLSEDMGATAEAAGPKALDAWKKANRYWRGREDRIQNVLSQVLGKDMNMGAEQAFSQINRWAQNGSGDPAKLGRAIRSMPDDEASTVRASFIQRMGQARKGAQDSAGQTFSPAEFVTQWNGLSPRAKATLFNDKDLRAALDDLATVTGGMKAAQRYANVSKTGNAVNGIALLSSLFASPIATAAIAGSQIGAGKLLSSQSMVRALTKSARQAESGKPQKEVVQGLIRALPGVASKDPNVRGIIMRMLAAANDNASRVAASGSDEQDKSKR